MDTRLPAGQVLSSKWIFEHFQSTNALNYEDGNFAPNMVTLNYQQGAEASPLSSKPRPSTSQPTRETFIYYGRTPRHLPNATGGIQYHLERLCGRWLPTLLLSTHSWSQQETQELSHT